ncbi:hypothetical protein ACJMK2_033920 [Sinanodonta woodiana]|uniref:Uncharacterized protein n=1 Tax=Sinanodonta woodiana TaxID=1069815 RepID=A0ABD3WS28_SINWO
MLLESRASTKHCSEPLDALVEITLTSQEGIAKNSKLDGSDAWAVPAITKNTYIQADLSKRMLISGIVTKGSPRDNSRVTHFKVLYSEDCTNFDTLSSGGEPLVLASNLAVRTTSVNIFHDIFIARCVRIVPTEHVGPLAALQFELLGCDFKSCSNVLTPASVQNPEEWNATRIFVFGSEKILSSVILSPGPNAGALDSFVMLYSRTCHDFDGLDIESHIEILKTEPEIRDITINNESVFPLRAQCFTVYMPSASGYDLTDLQVSFRGCDVSKREDMDLSSCGKTTSPRAKKRRKRVVGGDATNPGQWPWLVSLHYLKRHYFTQNSGLKHLCGGTLIKPQWVLTAAHCFDDVVSKGLANKTNWLVVLGEHNQANKDGTEQVLEIDSIIKHELFNINVSEPILNDIALLKLHQPAILSDYVNVICLEPSLTFPPGTFCNTAGWGMTETNGVGVEIPYHVQVPIMDSPECARRYAALPDSHVAKQSVSIVDSVLCASAVNGKDSCWGDSGGPLFCHHDNQWTQAGIISLGYTCGDAAFPGIYTKVAYYYDWIENKIRENS